MTRNPVPQSRAVITALMAVAPVIALGLAYSIHLVPESIREVSVDLRGEWKLADASRIEELVAEPSQLSTQSWRPLQLPGTFSADEMPREAWIARTFELSASEAGYAQTLLLGDTSSGVLEIYLNGHHVGSIGDPHQRRKTSFVGAYRLRAGSELVNEGENVVAIRAQWLTRAARIGSHRFLLGRASHVDIFHERTQNVWALLVYGPYAIAPLAGLLLLAMALVDTRGENRPAYFANLLMLVTATAYQDLLVGIASQRMSVATRDTLVYSTIVLFLVSVVEFVESYFSRRKSWFALLSRGLAGFTLVVTVLDLLNVGPIGTRDIYVTTSPYGVIVALYSIVLAARAVRNAERAFALPLLVATAGLVFAGFNDILRDLGLTTSPRLFILALSMLPLIAAATLLGDFLRLAAINQRLTRVLGRKNEELRAALAEADESQRLKSEFLANVSHELRTPLNAIINLPEGLLDAFAEEPIAQCTRCESRFSVGAGEAVSAQTPCPECGVSGTLSVVEELRFHAAPLDAQRYLRRVATSGRHLQRVVEDILDLSKLEAGRMTLQRESVELDALFEDVRATVAGLLEEHRVELVIEETQAEATLLADPVRLAQVLINLVGNAIKFSPSGGVVTVRANARESEWVFSVADQGIGISRKDQEIIFESFRQVEAGHTRRHAGSGLGLAITRALVELHGGTIELESELGKGSTFTVRLPSGSSTDRGS